ncbi:MAG TPA: hypothetical protein ENG01_01355, partial [Candidatus Aenigmarchaeota archaeon]|nr:hypothetical protein [Candidatus Aenigmarchaeota archaeon]HEX33044.1 hypothetical protein [Candidatus Aenigmarchaeota archaeon]
MQEVLAILEQIIQDKRVPRNIRETTSRVKDILLDDSVELSVRVDKAIQLLDEVSLDPNMPPHARTLVWH